MILAREEITNLTHSLQQGYSLTFNIKHLLNLFILWHVRIPYSVCHLSYFLSSLFITSILWSIFPFSFHSCFHLIYHYFTIICKYCFHLIYFFTAKQSILNCLENEKINLEKMEIASKKELDKQFEMYEIDRQKKQKWLEDENSR